MNADGAGKARSGWHICSSAVARTNQAPSAAASFDKTMGRCRSYGAGDFCGLGSTNTSRSWRWANGRARHSVRAVLVNQDAPVSTAAGNSGRAQAPARLSFSRGLWSAGGVSIALGTAFALH
jgi:hypothetical protein